MTMLNEAWETLRDPVRRAAYDRSPTGATTTQRTGSDQPRNAYEEATRREQIRKAAAEEQKERKRAAERARERQALAERSHRQRERLRSVLVVLALIGVCAWFLSILPSTTNKEASIAPSPEGTTHVASPLATRHAAQAQPRTKPRSHSIAAPTAQFVSPAPSAPMTSPAAAPSPPLAAAVADGNSPTPEARPTSTLACAERTVNSIADNGATVNASDGSSYRIPRQGMMRFEVAHWNIGEGIVVCRSDDSASISNAAQGDKVQAQYVGALENE